LAKLRTSNKKSDSIVLFVPGWARESHSFEEQMCYQLYQSGVDVGLVTKPYHQARTPMGTNSGEYFISANLYWTVRNFQQLVAELRLLIQYMKQHYKCVGLFGMSSGGFQSCLASNCEEVDFLFCFMTGCNLWDITWRGLLTTHVVENLRARGLNEEDVQKAWSICDEGVLGHNCKAKLRKHYITLYDQIVPPEHQYALWKSLGENEKIELPSAHYSGGLMARRVIADVASVMKKR
jgi:cephalosporin-C deacetylase-like acetyl esterase